MEQSCETNALISANAFTQAKIFQATETFTISEADKELNFQSLSLESNLSFGFFTGFEKVSKTVQGILESNVRISVLREYDNIFALSHSNLESSKRLNFESICQIGKFIFPANKLEVIDVEWNCLGNKLGISTGCQSGNSSILIFEVFKVGNRFESSFKPVFTRELKHFISCIRFHQNHPSLLSFGMVSGEIRVWHLTSAAEESFSCNIFSHDCQIVSLRWLLLENQMKEILISVDVSGKLIFWEYEQFETKYPWRIFSLERRSSEMEKEDLAGWAHRPVLLQARGRNKFDFNVIVSTSGNSIISCEFQDSYLIRNKERVEKSMESDKKIWAPSALEFVNNLPESERSQVKLYLERNNKEGKRIEMATIFSSKIKRQKICPTCARKVKNIELNVGQVLLLDFFKKDPDYILVGTSLGTILVFDYLNLEVVQQYSLCTMTTLLCFASTNTGIYFVGREESREILYWRPFSNLAVNKVIPESKGVSLMTNSSKLSRLVVNPSFIGVACSIKISPLETTCYLSILK